MITPTPARIGDQVAQEGDAWFCPCGNHPSAAGFYPVNDRHEAVEPTAEHWTSNRYGCFQFGAVIDQSTLRVVATADLDSLLASAGLTRTT